jgi:hypothetical protein
MKISLRRGFQGLKYRQMAESFNFQYRSPSEQYIPQQSACFRPIRRYPGSRITGKDF